MEFTRSVRRYSDRRERNLYTKPESTETQKAKKTYKLTTKAGKEASKPTPTVTETAKDIVIETVKDTVTETKDTPTTKDTTATTVPIDNSFDPSYKGEVRLGVIY